MPLNWSKIVTSLVVVLGICAIVFPRFFDLDRFLTADEKRWAANVNGFVDSLSHGELSHTFQQPHPGITTQWLGAPTIYANSWAIRKLPLVLGQSLLILITGYVFWRLWGKPAACILVFLLALNPVLIAHTRVYAMDSLLAIFFLLSLGLLLLWQKEKVARYLIASGVAAALAVLSKLPGILILPLAFLIIGSAAWRKQNSSLIFSLRSLAIWLAAFIITLPIVLPALLTNTWPVLQDIFSFFSSTDYQKLHPGSPWYYVGSLIFFTTPLHWTLILVLPLVFLIKIPTIPIKRSHLLTLLISAMAFVLIMSLGAKKGDRYILPTFVLLDAALAGSLGLLLQSYRHRLAQTVLILLIAGLAWQAALLYRLHPYYLAYVNPLTAFAFEDRRLGWGEGLDLAAEYLNQKPNASELKVASYYPVEFSYRFTGESVPAHQHDDENINYVVLYRAMFERGPDAWETDVLNQYRHQTPKKVIKLNNLEYVWIYKK